MQTGYSHTLKIRKKKSRFPLPEVVDLRQREPGKEETENAIF